MPELKAKCRARGLLVGGLKAELVERLVKADLDTSEHAVKVVAPSR